MATDKKDLWLTKMLLKLTVSGGYHQILNEGIPESRTLQSHCRGFSTILVGYRSKFPPGNFQSTCWGFFGVSARYFPESLEETSLNIYSGRLFWSSCSEILRNQIQKLSEFLTRFFTGSIQNVSRGFYIVSVRHHPKYVPGTPLSICCWFNSAWTKPDSFFFIIMDKTYTSEKEKVM